MSERSPKSYVIWRTFGAGFWSIVASTLAHCDLAERKGLIPVVDMQNFPSVYLEDDAVNGTKNVWEYYFSQPAGRSLVELGSHPFISDGTIPKGYPREIGDAEYKKLWQKHARIHEHISDKILARVQELEISSRTLGVHYRGQEMRTAVGHKFPPTLSQVNRAIAYTLDNADFDKVLLVTEGEQYVEYFRKKWGERIIPSPSFRLKHRNSYKLNNPPRKNHRFELGFEALQDAHLLASCGGFIRGHSGLSEAALLVSNGIFEPHIRISQGRNSFRPYVAPWKWYLKAFTPSSLGGFRQWKPD